MIIEVRPSYATATLDGVFEHRPSSDRAAMFFATGCHQSLELAQRLGRKRNEKGGIITDAMTGETSVVKAG